MHEHLGLVGSTSGNTLRVVPQVESKILQVEPASTPLLTLLDGLKRVEPLRGREFTIQEQWPKKWVGTSTAAYTAADVAITLDDGTFVSPDMIAYVPSTDEQMLVSSVAGNVVTVVRGSTLGLSSYAIASGAEILFTAPALREGQDKGSDVHRAPGMMSGYTQKVDSSAGITDVAQGLQYYGIDEYSRINQEMLKEFKKKINRMLLFSQPMKYTAAGTFPRWATGGLLWYSKLYNEFNMGGGVTWRAFDNVVRTVKRYGGPESGSKWILCGQKAASVFSGWAAESGILTQDAGKNEFGFDVTRIKAGGMTLNIVEDWNFEGKDLDHVAIIVDNRYLALKESEGYTVEQNVQTPGAHRKEWQMYRTVGLKCECPAAFGFLYNIKYAA